MDNIHQRKSPLILALEKALIPPQPLRYGFEGLLVNEFHTLNGQCATLIPQGPGYEGVSLENQVCTAVGSLPGQATVNGNRYVELSYGYSYSHLWRNFGVVVAFGVGFLSLYLLFTQLNTGTTAESSVTLFKRGSKVDVSRKAADEEKAQQQQPEAGEKGGAVTDEGALKETPVMKDVFSWQNLKYDVPVGGGKTRRLLDDISGYVAPGKLTALMGESGAGKVRRWHL